MFTDRQTECMNTFQLCWKVLKKEEFANNKLLFKYIYFYSENAESCFETRCTRTQNEVI